VLNPGPTDDPASRTGTGREPELSTVGLDLFLLDEWMSAYPGVVAGTTLRPADFGLQSSASAWSVSDRFDALGRALGFPTVAVARQVHGAKVIVLGRTGLPGFHVCGEGDGLASDREGLLMTATIADCVPVFLLDPPSRAAALLHAGWRGTVAGVLTRGLEALSGLTGSRFSDFRVHLGPAICGACYEVGPDVLARFGLLANGPGPLDLRDRLTEEALQQGVPRAGISRSPACTACDPERLHSHRGSKGTAGRMVAFIGHRTGSP
jgi:YfiH family protein